MPSHFDEERKINNMKRSNDNPFLSRELSEMLSSAPFENSPNSTALARFYDPEGDSSWYACSYDPHSRVFIGAFVSDEKEYCTFTLKDLEDISGPFGIEIQIDSQFSPTPLRAL